jgi:hypothetical protein
MAGQAASFPMFASMRAARNSGVVAEYMTLRPAPDNGQVADSEVLV